MNRRLAIVSRLSGMLLILGFLLIPCMLIMRYVGGIAAIGALVVEILLCCYLVARFLKNEGSTLLEFLTTPTDALFDAPPIVTAIVSLGFLVPGIYIISTADDPPIGKPESMTLIEQSVFGLIFTCFGLGLLGVALPVMTSEDSNT